MWKGKTVHQRFAPFLRRFDYKIALIDLDIDRLDEADKLGWAFGVDRSALYCFHRKDHGPRKAGADLRTWAAEMLGGAGVDVSGGTIRLVTFPKHMFFKFAPLSVWFGYNPSGQLSGVIYEVNNTFGEHHCYVAPINAERAVHEADKSFHVSPFMDVSGKYRFALQTPGDTLHLTVENRENGERIHLATIAARRQPSTKAAFAKLALMQPFASIGVIIGIHWEALRVWMRGAGYRRKPSPPTTSATVAQPIIEKAPARTGEFV
nr:DUF1365 domain-containing protein [Hyphomonas sediminis]